MMHFCKLNYTPDGAMFAYLERKCRKIKSFGEILSVSLKYSNFRKWCPLCGKSLREYQMWSESFLNKALKKLWENKPKRAIIILFLWLTTLLGSSVTPKYCFKKRDIDNLVITSKIRLSTMMQAISGPSRLRRHQQGLGRDEKQANR